MFDSVVELLNILLLDFSQLVPAFNDRCIEAIQVSKCVDEEIDVLHALVDGGGRACRGSADNGDVVYCIDVIPY